MTQADCPVCGERLKPADKRMCADCWRQVPARIRINLVAAYRFRVRQPARYQEALAALLTWCHEQRVRNWSVSSWVVDPVAHQKP